MNANSFGDCLENWVSPNDVEVNFYKKTLKPGKTVLLLNYMLNGLSKHMRWALFSLKWFIITIATIINFLPSFLSESLVELFSVIRRTSLKTRSNSFPGRISLSISMNNCEKSKQEKLVNQKFFFFVGCSFFV